MWSNKLQKLKLIKLVDIRERVAAEIVPYKSLGRLI